MLYRARPRQLCLALSLALTTLMGCAPEETPTSAVGGGATPPPTEVQWSYEGDTGPDRWGELKPEYAVCASGRAQSPVDIDTAAALEEELADLAFDYRPSALRLLHNGHTLEAAYDSGSFLELDGVRYELQQLHFHAPSEHTVDGAFSPLEIHLVHAAPDGTLAVVGVLASLGPANATYERLQAHFPDAAGEERAPAGETIDAGGLLPDDRRVFRYDGSLTTPPCKEGVLWSVLQAGITLSPEQVDAFYDRIGKSHRPVQPLGDRTVTRER